MTGRDLAVPPTLGCQPDQEVPMLVGRAGRSDRSYNRKLWMLGRLKGATYPPDC